MKSKFNLLVTILAVLVFTNLVMAQDGRVGRPGVPNLSCCKCLDGTNSLDLSTIPANKWTVNGSPVAFASPINPGWTLNPGAAQWVSTVVNGSMSWTSVPAGDYEYKLKFHIPDCTIDQEVTLSGNVAADNTQEVLLDGKPPALSTCNNKCWQIGPQSFSTSVGLGPGMHELVVKVKNSEGPSGMFVDAKLTGKCSGKLAK